MGEVTVLFIAMLLVGAVAFAPLGYFIYKFGKAGGKPFGETEPHGDSPSIVNDFAEKMISLFKSKMNKPS